MNIVKRIKLLFTKSELLDFFNDIDKNFINVNEYCKKKEWNTYDNIHKTLSIVEDNKKNEPTNSIKDDEWYYNRSVDVALKKFYYFK